MRPWLVLLPLAVGCSLVLLWLSAAPSTSLSPANRSRGPPFDPGRDTFVLLHIQKTGGTAFASALLFLNVSAEFGCVHWNGSISVSFRFGVTTLALLTKAPAIFQVQLPEIG
eukprot:m.250521 g.250521  ORF g.250521 m.250521 type:complete len:112 (-) comp54507_c0_seq25:1180-1515(-)